MISLYTLYEYWNYFFFDADHSSLTIGLFRFFWGIICCVNFILYLPDIKKYLGSNGYLETRHWIRSDFIQNKFSLFKYAPANNSSAYIIIWCGIVFSILLSVGFCTRWCAAIVYLIVVSVTHRNAYICSSGDSILRIFSFLLIFSRAGYCLSVDSYLKGSFLNDCGAPWAERLMQIQLCIIYFYSLMIKLGNSQVWRDGIAAYYVMNHKGITENLLPKFLLDQPFVQIATYGTLFIEFMVSIPIWITEIKPWSILMGYILHIGLEFCINIGLFGYIMMALLILFMDPIWILEFLNGLYNLILFF